MRYEVDPHNRLVVQEGGGKSSLSRFRRVLDGRFRVGPGNSLIYHVKSPMQGAVPEALAPHQVKLKGRWSLTKNHDLKLTLDKWGRQRPGDILTLQGEILRAEASSLLFAITTKTKEGALSTNILRLQGRWQADKNNRLTFRVKKEKGVYDILTFDGIWELSKSHRIVYHYERGRLKRKKKLKKIITFRGHWDIAGRNRLTYSLDLKGQSAFDFQVSAGRLDKNSMKYEVGIEICDSERPVRKIVTLSGRWRLKKNAGLLFEVEHEKAAARAIAFGATAKLTKRDEVKFKLKNKFGKDLGMDLTLSRKLFRGDGEIFLRLLKSEGEAAIHAGMARRW